MAMDVTTLRPSYRIRLVSHTKNAADLAAF